MNPLLSFLRGPHGRALLQHAIDAAGQHLIESITKAGSAGAAFQRVDPTIEAQRQQNNREQQQPRARARYVRDVHIKEADVLDVRVGEPYKYDPATDPDAP
jgi:hypothetical protein